MSDQKPEGAPTLLLDPDIDDLTDEEAEELAAALNDAANRARRELGLPPLE